MMCNMFIYSLSIEACCFYHYVGLDIQGISINIGPYRGEYTTCGNDTNMLTSGDPATYTCRSNARGTAIKISLPRDIEQHLALCQVAVFGAGNILVLLSLIKKVVTLNLRGYKSYHIIYFIHKKSYFISTVQCKKSSSNI